MNWADAKPVLLIVSMKVGSASANLVYVSRNESSIRDLSVRVIESNGGVGRNRKVGGRQRKRGRYKGDKKCLGMA